MSDKLTPDITPNLAISAYHVLQQYCTGQPADCKDQCQNCVIQRIMNEYTEQEKELKKYREIGTIEECQVAMEKFIEEAQLHEALRVLDERM